MTTYEETIAALKGMCTVTGHIKNLGSILMKTEDAQLKGLLSPIVTNLQRAHANGKVRGKTTPGNLYNGTDTDIKNLIRYCEGMIGAKKPEWQVMAERAGWTPPQT